MYIRQIITATALYAFLAAAAALPSVSAFADDSEGDGDRAAYEMAGSDQSGFVTNSEDLGSAADETALLEYIKEIIETN